ncbi:MAG: glutathione synthase, partial [Pseudomonadota bacterium]
MPLSVAIQMDPIQSVDVHADSTFHLAMEAQGRGHSLFYYHVEDLVWREGRVMATGRDLEVRREQGDHYTLGERRLVDLSTMDVVLLRQDPPFD